MLRILLFLTLLVSVAVRADTQVLVSESKNLQAALSGLEDAQLRRCVADFVDKRKIKSVDQLKSIKCHSKKIRSVTGLEKFTNLMSISLHNNHLQTFEPALFPQLEKLNLTKNRLKTFEAKALLKLQELYVIANQLERLSLFDLPALQRFKVNRNQLIEFNHQGLTSLKRAYLFDNKLEDTDIHQVKGLVYLDVRQNPMPDELYEEMDAIAKVTILHDGNAEDWQ